MEYFSHIPADRKTRDSSSIRLSPMTEFRKRKRRLISELLKIEKGRGLEGGLSVIRFASLWMYKVGILKQSYHSLILPLIHKRNQRLQKDPLDEMKLYFSNRRKEILHHLSDDELAEISDKILNNKAFHYEARNTLGVSDESTNEEILRIFKQRDFEKFSQLHVVLYQYQSISKLKFLINDLSDKLQLRVDKNVRKTKVMTLKKSELIEKMHEIDMDIDTIKFNISELEIQRQEIWKLLSHVLRTSNILDCRKDIYKEDTVPLSVIHDQLLELDNNVNTLLRYYVYKNFCNSNQPENSTFFEKLIEENVIPKDKHEHTYDEIVHILPSYTHSYTESAFAATTDVKPLTRKQLEHWAIQQVAAKERKNSMWYKSFSKPQLVHKSRLPRFSIHGDKIHKIGLNRNRSLYTSPFNRPDLTPSPQAIWQRSMSPKLSKTQQPEFDVGRLFNEAL